MNQDILQEVREFAEHDFPLDFIGVAPGWRSMAYPWKIEEWSMPDEFSRLNQKKQKTSLFSPPAV